MIDQTLKTAIEKYQEFSGYMSDDAVIGTNVGFVRKLINSAYKQTADLPTMIDVERLSMVIQDTTQPAEIRTAISNSLRVISELQTQIRGMKIEHAEELRRKALGDASNEKIS